MANRDQAEGELKEQADRLTDAEREGEGDVHVGWGDAKEKGEDLKDDVRDAADEARDKLD
jgi:uncharacterized protein YjbJ (UPF0337 family)